MTIENYLIISDNGVHEYTITVERENGVTKYLLFASQNSPWSEHIRGSILTTLVDDGNGFHILDTKYLDYSDAQQLRMLLNFSTLYDDTAAPMFTVVQEKSLGKI